METDTIQPIEVEGKFLSKPDKYSHSCRDRSKMEESDGESRTTDEALRVLYLYFREISDHPRLKKREEEMISANLRYCRDKANLICSRLKGLHHRRLRKVDANCHISGHKVGMNLSQIRRTVALMRAYSTRADELRNRFVNGNLRLVVHIANKYRGRGITVSDLVQEGNIGLLKAVEKFDHRLGYTFSTYAVWWIQHTISRSVLENSKLVRVPSYINERASEIRRASSRLENETGEKPTAEEISKRIKVNVDAVRYVLNDGIDVLYLESDIINKSNWKATDYEKLPPLEMLSVEKHVPPDYVATHVALKKKIQEALTVLSMRESDIIKRRYGLEEYSPHTLGEIARMYGLTRERVRQIEKQSLRRMRSLEGNDILKSFFY